MAALRFELADHARLSPALRHALLDLCSDAYEEDFTPHFALLGAATHVLAYDGATLVSHAAWLPRSLRTPALRRPLRAAYVEAVATRVALQRRGYGSAVMGALAAHVSAFDLAALSPSEPAFYARLGWESWRGPLSYVHEGRTIATPDEEVMILRLPRTPPSLDVTAPLEGDFRPGDVW